MSSTTSIMWSLMNCDKDWIICAWNQVSIMNDSVIAHVITFVNLLSLKVPIHVDIILLYTQDLLYYGNHLFAQWRVLIMAWLGMLDKRMWKLWGWKPSNLSSRNRRDIWASCQLESFFSSYHFDQKKGGGEKIDIRLHVHNIC
jgi:hypothetical protein